MLRNKLQPRLHEFMVEDYEGVAIHSSSILVCANPAALDMFGYLEEEIIGKNSWALFKPQDANVIMQHLLEKSEEPYRVTAIKKDRTEFDIEMKGKDFVVNGTPVRAVLLKRV